MKRQLLELAKTPAIAGGLSAEEINFEEELFRWFTNAPELQPTDANITQQAERDLKGSIFSMIGGPKRKAFTD